ncbi:TetR/AcrR family transcriptional regulator [Fictibacillus barbaricus]|uniref:AcrR family transcriptional regulator n=1 Tax=Fictibacillus barbaricus TaxID=182136 RepID=A0ABU1U3X2_9BACL|nr:TetR/AcrR family transcriptional regulator [Fictibacillus barbaricus]MDR7074113.1 AcrR family transcriptional regulator [Fictibacillus barbaricus]
MSPKVTESHKEERKRNILDAAKKIFKKKGYEAFVMQDVIDAVDLSRGGVYSYFSNKEDLFLSILESMNEAYENELNEFAKKPSIWEALKDEFEGYKNMKDDEDAFSAVQIEYFLINRRAPQKTEYFNDRYRFAIAQLVNMFKQGVENGEFKPNYPIETIAKYFITFNDGLHIASIFIKKNEMNFNEQVDLFLQQLGTMLGVEKL